MFWFQGTPFSSDQPPEPVPEVVSGLIALYQEGRADILCLQEIQEASVAAGLGEALGWHWVYDPGGVHVQYGGAILSRWPIERLVPHDSDRSEPVDRVAQRVRIRIDHQRALIVGNVHLPSSRQRGPEGGQAKRLADLPRAVGGSGGNPAAADVIAGDFNETPDGPCAAYLSDRGYRDAARLWGAQGIGTTLSGRRIDQIWVRESMASAVASYFVVPKDRMRAKVAEKTFLSDHLAIGVELDLGGIHATGL